MPEASWLTGVNSNHLVVLLLMIVRIGALLITTPILGARTVPAMTKIGLAIVLALVLLPTASANAVLPPTFGHLILGIGKEMVVGLLAGFAITLLLTSLQMAATLAGMQIGFGFSNTVDVTYSGQTPVLDHLFTGMATLIFFTGNFHHQFLIGLQGLFTTMPSNGFSVLDVSPEGLIALGANMFLVAVRIVLPLLGALLLADVALGIMARTSPQMNVFFVGMPVKLALGIFAIMVMLPYVIGGIEAIFGPIAQSPGIWPWF